MRPVWKAINYHIVGLTYAYGVAVLAIGTTLSLGTMGYVVQQVFECGIACIHVPSAVDLVGWALALPISAVLTFVMSTVGAAAVLALPPFIVVPAYMLAFISSKLVRRPVVVAAVGAILGPVIGVPTLILWHHFASDPAYRGSLSSTFGKTSLLVYLLAAVAGAVLGFAIARRERSASTGV